jgi:hypothetical protein
MPVKVPAPAVESATRGAFPDRHGRMALERDAGVPKYVVRRTRDGAIDRFRPEGGARVRVEPDG